MGTFSKTDESLDYNLAGGLVGLTDQCYESVYWEDQSARVSPTIWCSSILFHLKVPQWKQLIIAGWRIKEMLKGTH